MATRGGTLAPPPVGTVTTGEQGQGRRAVTRGSDVTSAAAAL